ncbi:MAG: TIGR01212 family radical SAM protein [Spirochaetes bacterium]|nr:TIGR01212 family radical SAM protein [Spirochaetota bacterium]
MSLPINHSESYIFSNKPYNFFGDYLREKYGFRVFKLPINAFLGCPNRIEGSGCIFCSDSGSASPSVGSHITISDQMRSALNALRRSDVQTRYIAYFQAYTNTYGDLANLKSIYDEALAFDDIMGLMIGTRPDTINDQIASLIKNYDRSNFELWIELGMQSIHNPSLDYLRRGHSFEDTRKSIDIISRYDIQVSLHVILGIPGESWDDMMKTAETISSMPVNGVKIHHLHVLRNTPLNTMYERGEVPLLSFKSYVSLLCDFVERLRKDITIHRIAGDALEDILVAPRWGLEKGTVQKAVIDEFNRRGTWQGFFCED